MKLSEIIETTKISFDSLLANKMRSSLASLGVVIGISFVILMSWIIGALDMAVDKTFQMLGTDMLYLDKWSWSGEHENWKEIDARKNITLDQAEKFIESMKSSEICFPQVRTWSGVLKYNNKVYSGISILGTVSDYGKTSMGQILLGRNLSPFEDINGSNAAVIGHKVYVDIFNKENPIGKEIKIGGVKVTIVGVITQQGNSLFDFIDNQVVIPLQTFKSNYGLRNFSITIAVKAGSMANLDNVRTEAIGNMRIVRNLKPNQKNDFSINETKAFESSIKALRMGVWGVGLGMTVLSFIVGIIGIMNIMFVSVTERTKEIGIRKAIGAKRNSILVQFVIESASLCFLGALVSLILCSGIVYGVATIIPKYYPSIDFINPYLQPEMFFIASLISVIVGVLAGIIPAFRAAKLDPVDSLRFE